MRKQFAILLSVLLMLCACQSPKEEPSSLPLPDYEIAIIKPYTFIDKEYCTYSIVLSPNCSDEELFAVARYFLDDGYDQHDFYFYREATDIGKVYTVGRIEEEDDGSLMLIRARNSTSTAP